MVKKLIGIIGFLVILYALYSKITDLRDENSRLSTNIEVLNSDISVLRNSNGDLEATIQALRYDYDELESYKDSIMDELKRLKIKKNEIKVVTNTDYVYRIDTLLVKEPSGALNYQDEWTTFHMEHDSISFQTSFSLKTYLYERKRKKFLFWRYGKRDYYQKIIVDNPNIEIKDTELIIVNE